MRFVSALLIAFIFAFPAYAEEFSFSFIKERLLPKPDSYQVNVKLLPDGFSEGVASYENIYDFKNKTVTMINHADKTYMTSDLRAAAHQIHAEKLSRNMLHKALIAAKVFPGQSKQATPMDIEMDLGSAETPPTIKRLTRTQKGEQADFYQDGKRVMATVTLKEDVKIPAALSKSYNRFLLYKGPGQQDIREYLVSSGRLFDTVGLKYIAMPEGKPMALTYLYLPMKAVPANAPSFDPKTYAEVYDFNNVQLNEALKKAHTIKEIPNAASFVERMENELDKNRPMAAFLIFYEMTTTHGPSVMGLAKTTVQRIFAPGPDRARLQELHRMMGAQAKSKEDLAKHRALIAGIRKDHPEGAAVLDIMLANDISQMFGPKLMINAADEALSAEPEKLFLDALVGKPWITGAWMDLGTYYSKQFDFVRAYNAWEVAGALNPNNPAADNFKKTEAMVEKSLPGYF